MERRLSAILAADMVGYSRLMEADEIGTIERQKALHQQINSLHQSTFGSSNDWIISSSLQSNTWK